MTSNQASTSPNQTERPALYGVVEGFYGRPWTPSQRRELFKRMKFYGLNTYMYAPKDDFKHRAYWRELYSVEEAESMISLINAAKEYGIMFYYALSPGLDITFSNAKEIACLKRKLEQVQQFGCEAFALLFDDIEPEISETDKEVFHSFGHAQISITNEVYQALGQPNFMFCPTEYCTTRAVPNIRTSEYLQAIGNKLMPDIDIMWTGNKVISKTISVQSMQELTDVLRRKPVIWDNIHANDYDTKRVFLGPYGGRSTDVIPYLRGVLTNPNCEFESNFIAIHTIAQWSKCVEDAKSESCASGNFDARLETETEDGSDNIPVDLNPNVYHPRKALQVAIRAWLPEFNRVKLVYTKPSNVHLQPNPLQKSALKELEETTEGEKASGGTSGQSSKRLSLSNSEFEEPIEIDREHMEPGQDSLLQPISKELTNSLIPEAIILQPIEPMDCVPLNAPKTGEENVEKLENLLNEPPKLENLLDEPKSQVKSFEQPSEEEMQTEMDNESALTVDDLTLLVDLFYLPFEHGPRGIQLLNEFNWLRSNSHILSRERVISGSKRKSSSLEASSELQEWNERAKKFDQLSNSVGKLLTKLTFCKNRCLVHEIYPYLWDIRGVVCLLNAYVKWLALGTVPNQSACFIAANFTWFSKGYREAFSNGEQEPWIFRGGLTGDLQRLLPIESINDLFLYKPPENPSSHIEYSIRPYLPSDEPLIYDICRKIAAPSIQDGSNELPDLLGDKFVGSFLAFSPEFCFVVEDDFGLVGYLLGAPDCKQFEKKLELAWMPDLCSKYPAPVDKLRKGEKLTGVEKMINEMHDPQNIKRTIPACVYSNHPSICRLGLLGHVLDCSVPKRLMSCLLAALKANGSTGLFSIVNAVTEKPSFEFYSKLGFQEIPCPEELRFSEDEVFLGRVI